MLITWVATDGGHAEAGWHWDVNSDAPAEATFVRPQDGKKVVDKTVPNWNGPGNPHAVDHMLATVGLERVFIIEAVDETNLAVSKNECFAVEFF